MMKEANTKLKVICLHDQHVHSKYSRDSQAELEIYYKKAYERGCKYFITTEHLEKNIMSTGDDWNCDFKELKKELSLLQKKYPSVIPLLGVEIGYRKENEEWFKEMVKSEDFDLINLSIHENGIIEYYYQDMYASNGIDGTMKIYFEQMIEALNRIDDFDVLSHFDYGFKTAFMIDNTFKISRYEEYLKKIFELIITKNKTLEINAKVQDVITDKEHLDYVLDLYKTVGGQKLTISSDTHVNKNYLFNFDDLCSKVKKHGFKYLSYFVKRCEYFIEL